MDVLSDVLDSVKLLGTIYFTTDFTPPWGIKVPALRRVARFHVALRGTCWVRTCDGSNAELLDVGDLALVPHGAEHTLSDAVETPCAAVDHVVEATGFRGDGPLVIEGGGDSPSARLLCGHLELDESIEHPLFTTLPALIVGRRHEVGSGVDVLVRLVAHEVNAGRPGTTAMTRRLSEMLFIETVRSWAESEGPDEGLIAAFADAHVSRALGAIHAAVARPWTLASLAAEAHLSRTAFAARFRRLVGMTTMQYVSFWRMQKARELLARTPLTVDAVALEVGYESLPAFSRAFKRWVGESPGVYRRRV